MIGLRKIGVYTGGYLIDLKSKMAHGIVKYRDDVVVIIDNIYYDKKLSQILPIIKKNIPIVSTVEQAIHEFGINEIVFGISPPGGELPIEWEEVINYCLKKNLKLVHGFHIELSCEEQYILYANDKKIVDLRYLNHSNNILQGFAKKLEQNVILTMGTDCASGKMTTAIELYNSCIQMGLNADIIPTGQTGMYIFDKGFAIDAIRADFMSGTVEEHVINSAKTYDYIFIEGQGSLFHPAYSNASISLLHGASPNYVVLCHEIGREKLSYFDTPLIPIEKQISIIKSLAFCRDCEILGISVFCSSGNEKYFSTEKRILEDKYELPVFSIFQDGCKNIIDILVQKNIKPITDEYRI